MCVTAVMRVASGVCVCDVRALGLDCALAG